MNRGTKHASKHIEKISRRRLGLLVFPANCRVSVHRLISLERRNILGWPSHQACRSRATFLGLNSRISPKIRWFYG